MRDFSKVRIALASPDRIRDWSYGEVEKPETINYRTLKPERDGLFDERIFGPEKDYECACGKYKRQRYEGKTCERCGVEVTKSVVRRYRMGHIELATPCAHIWYVKDIPSKIGTLLDLSATQLEQVLYFAKYIVTDPREAMGFVEGDTTTRKPLLKGELLADDEYRKLRFGSQETYSLPVGTKAEVGDGEVVTKGKKLGGNVVSKLDGIALYRFPRSIELWYDREVQASMIVPNGTFILNESLRKGEAIAQLTGPHALLATRDGVAQITVLGDGDGALITVRDPEDETDKGSVYLAPKGMNVLVGDGELVETDQRIAEADGGNLLMPKGAHATGVSVKRRGPNQELTMTVHWLDVVSRDVNPTMHVMLPDGARFNGGQRVVGAIDPSQEIVVEDAGEIHLYEPASIVVVNAKVYTYDIEPMVVNGDRVNPGDDLADGGQIKSELSGRVEIDIVRHQVRVIESYDFDAKMGAEAIGELLKGMDLVALESELVLDMDSTSRHKKAKARKRLEVVRAFRTSGNRPEWMILDVVPVMPPDLRPMVQVDGGRFATSDLNDLYRRLINRNNRLKKLIQQGAPEMIIRNEKRMLQEAVDALIDNGRRGTPVTHPGSDRPLRSLTDLLGGKQGRFRQNLLGKRVDYSGRSVIVVGPQLQLHQCGIPKRMALELFKPFLFKVLEEKGLVTNIKQARKMLERYRDTRDEIWDALEEVIQDKVVMLNRAPTLHRLGIQAFMPVLVEGQAIQLHPLVCEAFNADFDGDQMAIHVPLSAFAQAEARIQMLSAHNLLSPANGEPNVKPSRDMILGIYSLTAARPGHLGANRSFETRTDALLALEQKTVDLNAKIVVEGIETTAGALKYRFSSVDEAVMAVHAGELDTQDSCTIRVNAVGGQKIVMTTTGRALFHRNITESLTRETKLERDFVRFDTTYEKNALRDLVMDSFKSLGLEKTANLLDALKDYGFELSTTTGISIGVDDVVIPPQKKEILAEADKQLAILQESFDFGLTTDQERFAQVTKLWNDTTDRVTRAVFDNFAENYPFNPLYIMSQSGARGNPQQIRQLAGMRGLMAKPNGETIEVPIRANFREGLTVLEYFISTHGARKGGADTALRTADSGYLTRKLHDVAHEVVVREEDCGTSEGIEVPLFDGEKPRRTSDLDSSLYGRTLADGIQFEIDGRETRFDEGHMLSLEDLKLVFKGRDREHMSLIKVRSPLTCSTSHGVCQKCYGYDLSQAVQVSIGEAVGVVAAESIGEPGTQLTMRTFHSGGIAGGQDITQGLPRVIELVEARKPKLKSYLAKLDGSVHIEEEDDKFIVTIGDGGEFSDRHKIEKNRRLNVREGDSVHAGDSLARGPMDPHLLLEAKGPEATQRYLVDGIQQVYRSQGVKVHDKHIETIVRQMFKFVEVLDGGDSIFLEGQTLERHDVEVVNEELIAAGKNAASWKPVLLGITKAALSTRSWLSAASFQHTTHVLTESSIAGKVDELVGLKENVILGKLIPAGTGLEAMKRTQVLDERLRERVLDADLPRGERRDRPGQAVVEQTHAHD